MGDSLASEIGPAAINAAGKTTLRQAAALLKRCRLFIGNDSGVAHLAAAARVPVVMLSWLAADCPDDDEESEAGFRPWQVDQVVLHPPGMIPPCRHKCRADEPHCICEISVESVKAAVTRLLPRCEGERGRTLRPAGNAGTR